jgi:hypothetical protein
MQEKMSEGKKPQVARSGQNSLICYREEEDGMTLAETKPLFKNPRAE